MKKKTICFDIDGVICKTNNKNNYIKSKPIKKNIKYINKLYDEGFKIIVFTGRFMGRNNENIFKAKKVGFNFTKNQLKKWGLKYNKLIFGKPSYDIFIDDRCFFFKKHWHNSLLEYLKKK
jgi:histidinol phosphatase-like enzyme